MAALTSRARNALPNGAFAWIDSDGRRRLPIHDEAHVRNALARFSRTPFESPEAREKARKRLLRAAKKYGIVPIGFIDGQLKTARDGNPSDLPHGEVTFLRSDIEGSTALVRRLDGGYAAVLEQVRSILRAATRKARGFEIDARGDEFLAAFASPRATLEAAIAIQRALAAADWPDGVEVRVRIGLHTGRPRLTRSGYIGVDVTTITRLSDACHGGQIIVSEPAYRAITRDLPAATEPIPAGARFRRLGTHRLRGVSEPSRLYQVVADGLARDFPPLRLDVPAAAPEAALSR